MGGFSVFVELLKDVGVYKKSMLFFVAVTVLLFGGYEMYHTNALHANSVPASWVSGNGTNSLDITLNQNGQMYVGTTKISPDIFTTNTTYRYRYQVVDDPTQYIDSFQVNLTLPQNGSDTNVNHNFISNGVATTADSVFSGPNTITYLATGITPSAQLSIEVEVPKSFVTPSPIFLFSQKLSDIPIADWTYLSLFLPLLTLIVLIIVGANRFGGVGPAGAPISDLPSRLPPAMVGILLNGKLSTRDIAATFIDLAIRGHLVIRQFAYNDFRFSRLQSTDQLAPFEATLLSQIFGPLFDKTSSAEISLLLSKEVFSTRVSSAFLLAYNEIGKLGYFKTNPLAYHLRYQIISIVLFIVGLAGFVLNIIIVPGLSYVLLAWAGMMISALVIYAFALGLPVRTLEGDRELARWLSLRSYLTDKTEVPFTALVQEQYQRLLPYSIVMEAEVAWTRRFFEMPFAVPDWYLADNIGTIDQFANSLFPLSGYLSHSLSATVAPSVR